MRGFEIQHDSMLLTIFSASNYGGVCRNRGGVLIFDEKGPAEVKEFYAPTLDQIREMYDTRTVQKVMPKVNQWRAQAGMGTTERSRRQQKRGLQQQASEQWLYLLSDVDAHGKLSAGAAAELRDVENTRTSVGDASDDSGRLSKRTQSKFTAEVNDRSSIKRHSLQAAPLRGDSKGDGGSARITSVVFTDEMDADMEADEDILRAMICELCKNKAQVGSAFAEAELALEKESGEGSFSREESSRFGPLLPYDHWLQVLCEIFPVFSRMWRVYGEKLVGKGTTVEKGSHGKLVRHRLWLDRFQVRLNFDQYGEFQHSVLQTLGERLGVKTKEMSLAQLLNYFDPDRDGSVTQKELLSTLQGLDLGLSKLQLRQLMTELGFADPRIQVDPVEVMVMLLRRLPLNAKSSEIGLKHQAQHAQVRSMIHKNMKDVKDAFNSSLLALFTKADADSSGLLSYQETSDILTQLQEKCGASIVSADDMAEFVQSIDIDNSGAVTFLEFVFAFGLDATDSGLPAGEKALEGSLAVLIMEQICSALYQLDHGLQKAFTHIDVAGTGWLSAEHFEKALIVVASAAGAERQMVHEWQISALTRSLRGSSLCDSEGRVDYARFVSAFYVDVANVGNRKSS